MNLILRKGGIYFKSMNFKNIKELRESLESNSPKIMATFHEKIYAIFQLNDKNGDIININDISLEKVEDEDEINSYKEYTTYYEKYNLYYGRIERLSKVEVDKDVFIEYLDYFLDEDPDEDEMSLEDFEWWCIDYGMELEDDFGGDTEEFIFKGENDSFSVKNFKMEEQKDYRLDIDIY